MRILEIRPGLRLSTQSIVGHGRFGILGLAHTFAGLFSTHPDAASSRRGAMLMLDNMARHYRVSRAELAGVFDGLELSHPLRDSDYLRQKIALSDRMGGTEMAERYLEFISLVSGMHLMGRVT